MGELVVITRPIEDARDYADELSALGYQAFVEPMLKIEPVAFDVPDLQEFDGLLVTSANAILSFMRGCDGQNVCLDIPVYCVGKYSAAAARNAGFVHVISMDGTGAGLWAHIQELKDFKEKRFLHICGQHLAFPLVETIGAAGGDAHELVVYQSVKVEAFSDALIAKLRTGEVGAVTFFSKRTADAFVKNAMSCFNEDESESVFGHIKALSISDAVVKCVRVLPWHKSYAAEAPDRAGMLKLLKAYV